MQFAVFINIHIKLLTSVQMYDKLFYYEKEFLIRSCLFAIGKRTNGGKSTSLNHMTLPMEHFSTK